MAEQLSRKRTNLLVAVLFLGGFVLLLGETFMNNALPQVMRDMHVNQATAQWVSTGYMMVSGLMIPVSAWTFHRFQLRPTFFTLMLIFIIGCAISWFSPSFGWLLAGRLIQAVSAGTIIPLTNNVLLVAYPKKIRGMMMGLSGIIISFAPAIGPSLSGWVIDHFGWRMLFGILTPVSAVILFISFFTTKNITSTRPVKIDGLGLMYETLGLGAILFALSTVGNDGKITLTVIVSLVVGIILCAFFVHRSNHVDDPVANLRVLKNRHFDLMTLLSSTSNIALVGIELVMPLYNQDVRGLSAFHSGLTLLLGAILMGIMNPISGWLYDRMGIKKLAIIGNTIVVLGTLPMLFFNQGTSIVVIVLTYAFRCVGIGFSMMSLFTASINALPKEQEIDGNAVGSTLRQVAGSLGTAVMMMVVSLCAHGTNHVAALANGYHAAYLTALIIAVFSLVLSCLLPKKA